MSFTLVSLCVYLQNVSRNFIKNVNVQGFIIIRDEDSVTSRIRDLASKFLWEVTSHSVENKENKAETVLLCRKNFWAIV